MVPYSLLYLRPPLTSPRRSGVPPGKARHIRPPRLRRYAHRCVCFARRHGTSAPGPCPSVARSARGPVGGGGLRALCGGNVRSPEGGGGLGGGGAALTGRLSLSGAVGATVRAHGGLHLSIPKHSCPGGKLPRGRSKLPSGSAGWPHLYKNRVHLPGGGKGAQPRGVVGASCKAHGEPSSSMKRAHRPGGGRGVQPRGWSGHPSRPTGGHHPARTGRTGLGGTGSPAQGVVGASFKAYGGPSSSENRAHRPWGGRGVQPRGWSEPPARPVGSRHPPKIGRTCLGGTGSPAQGVVRASCKARGEPSSSKNRVHRPGGGHGVQPRGWSEPPARPMGSHHLPRTGRTGPGGTRSPARGLVVAFFRGGWRALWGRWQVAVSLVSAHLPWGGGPPLGGGQ